MSAHTPGPWTLAEKARAHVDSARMLRSVIEGTDHGAVGFFVIGSGGEIAQANASLIAAAPDLLDALSNLIANEAANVANGPRDWEQARNAMLAARSQGGV